MEDETRARVRARLGYPLAVDLWIERAIKDPATHQYNNDTVSGSTDLTRYLLLHDQVKCVLKIRKREVRGLLHSE